MKFHFYKIKVDEKYFYRILNNSKDFTLHNLKHNNEIFSFEISFRDIGNLNNKCNALKIPIIEQQECGIYKKVVNKSFIQKMCCIIAVFILLLLINSMFIWNISIDGNYTNSSEEIINYIKQSISIGNAKSLINIDELEKALRAEYENISWVCVEVKGTSLLVHIKEAYIAEIAGQEERPYNIVANKVGVIKSILTRKGKAQVKVGDTVAVGDVLIAGKVTVLSEYQEELFDRYYSSDGTIKAEVTEKIEERLNKKYKYKNNSKISHVYLPTLSNYSWDLKLSDRNITREISRIKLWGDFYLPLSIEKYTIEKADYETKEYTLEEAKEILNNKLLYKLSKMEQKDYKILKKDVKIVEEENCFKLIGKIQCVEPIGKLEYITVDEVEEGTTNLNEYN